ncbi:PadR family transcriptional regulator [Natronosporangium hydrolyticum]|uniref:PadR family transcriptional regulator n=1 Tax=Natronosporangium hydrolyticum TaxID=2811111 RepID=A0A895Y6R5_9ACTN|nr:PadR family transcriptional regulator [Natronosporangium hydrolyticum]QSB13437.1 PadR family transcriptional regulator [Natronosporangium hydrolyticum]
MAAAEERRAQWLRGALDLCVLAALVDRERYGYELSQRLAAAGLGQVKGGTLYPLLARLETAGLVTSRWQPGEQGPGRKYYRLTAAGQEQLATQAAAWSDFAGSVGALLGSTGEFDGP